MRHLTRLIHNFFKMLSWLAFVFSICAVARSLFYGDFPIDLSLPLFAGSMCLVAIFELPFFDKV